jgi:transcriptional regulator with XRE-family HTH domain
MHNQRAMGMREFGELIREARGHKSAHAVALAVDVSYSMIADFERGAKTHPPAPELLAKLSTELGLTERRMLRAMGYLSTEEDALSESFDVIDPIERGILKLTPMMKDADKRTILAFTEFLASRK